MAAPLVISDEAVRLAVIDKLGWIRRQKAKFAEQSRQSQREMVNGESHYFLGQRYRLRVHERDAPARVATLQRNHLSQRIEKARLTPSKKPHAGCHKYLTDHLRA